jgi:hypothetical protein
MQRAIRFSVVVGLAVVWAGCWQVDPIDGPDAMPMVDAGIPDAVPVDAPPPWDPPEPILPDDPCVILDDATVSNGHEVLYDASMANYSVRFKDGMGLEASSDIRQTGLLEVENADLDKRETVEKRLGADVLADTKSAAGAVIADADKRSIWARYDEVILQTDQRIFSKKDVTDTGSFLWRDVGAFTQMRSREAYANAFAVDVESADAARVGDATVVGYELAGNDVFFAAYGPTMTQESVETLTGNGSRPRISSLGSDAVMVTMQLHGGAFPLVARRWDLNTDPPMPIVTNPVAVMPAINGVWDVHGLLTEDTAEEVTAWVAAAPLATNITTVVLMDGVTGTSGPAVLAGAATDMAVAVWPRRVAGGTAIRVVTAAVFPNGPTQTLNITWIDFDPATGAIVDSQFQTGALTDTTSVARSVALSFSDRETVYIAVEQDVAAVVGPPAYPATRKVSYFGAARPAISPGLAPAALGIVHQTTALIGQGCIISGTPGDTLISAGADPLTPAFVEQLLGEDATQRSGWVTYSPRTGEVFSRSMVGYTGDAVTRAARPPKGSVVVNGDDIAWGGAVKVISDPGNGYARGIAAAAYNLTAIATCRLDRRQLPNAPAIIDGSVISAHAGYPRAYDGTNEPFEHDWHAAPHIVGITESGVGSYTQGNVFTIAATWAWDDANGIRYRSAPGFITYTIVGATTATLNVTVEAFTHTERSNVILEVWKTTGNGSSLFRQATAATTGSNQAVALDDVTEEFLTSKEQLDQAPVPLGLGIQEARPARVTDFVTRAGDRLFSRDPLAGKLARFSIPSREASGYSINWPLGFAIEEPEEREVTGALEMDGRIVIGSTLGLALLTADGPDATGAGSFGLPTTLRTEIGIADQAQLARTPLGYVFGTADGPRLLTPGLTVEDIGKLVERVYKIDGGVITAIVYDQIREELVVLGSAGATLRLNTSTGRWGSDPNRLGRDLTVTLDGTIYLIRYDGKVLEQVQNAWADGATGYALAVSTPWVRDMARDGTTHSSFRLNAIHVSGEYLGAHDLFFDVYKDFNDAAPWGTFQVEAADITANNTANRGWIYGVRIGGRDSFYAARIVVRDGAEENQTFRLAQVDVDVETNGSSKYAELPATHYAAKV